MDVISLKSLRLRTDEPLQVQIYQQLYERIVNGFLPPGSRLPASRTIALELGVSRNTISAVIDQLKSEGLIETRKGSGVFIAQQAATFSPANKPDYQTSGGTLPELSAFGQQLSQAGRQLFQRPLPLTPGLPDMKAFPFNAWLKIQRRHEDRQQLMGYGGGQGYRPLKEALAHYLTTSKGVRCTEENIIITQGSQQALSLCSLVLLNEGDSIVMDFPCYQDAYQAFSVRNMQISAAPSEEDGLAVEQLPNQTSAKLIYTNPTYQYPTGAMLSTEKRLALLDWAAAAKQWIIEDDIDSEFHFYDKPVNALQGMGEQLPVIFIGSFSKTLYPSLRLGYMVVPRPLVTTFVQAKLHTGGESPLLSQATVADFMAEGHFAKHLRRMHQVYKKKWQHGMALVEQHLAGLVTPMVESSGMNVVLEINSLDDTALQQDYSKAGFGGQALSSFYCPSSTVEGRYQGMVLGLANSSSPQREEGIIALKKLLS